LIGTGRLAKVVGLAALVCACAPEPAVLPPAPVPAGPAVAVQAVAAPLNPERPAEDRVGGFAYAGGLQLTSTATSRLHGLSDLLVAADGSLTAVGDEGDLLQGMVVLDRTGRLVGFSQARLTALVGLDGKPLMGKQESDAEGMALLPTGDRLISFEQHHRVWLYPATGGSPQPAPAPDAAMPPNAGMEALSADPAAGPDAYQVAAEQSGERWACRLSTTCVKIASIPLPADFAIVAMRRLPAGDMAYLLRAYDPLRGSRIILRIEGPTGEVDRLELSRPLTVDNFEGMDAVPGEGGSIRFYLVSDDNFSSSQRTLLLAFDWKPKPKGDDHEPH
jgi:hypothetical protein